MKNDLLKICRIHKFVREHEPMPQKHTSNKSVQAISRLFIASDLNRYKAHYNHWKDKSFVAEMDRRYREYKSGNARLFSLDEVEEKARELAKEISTRSTPPSLSSAY